MVLRPFLVCCQGGAKVLLDVMRTFIGGEAHVLVLASRVMHKCCVGSPSMQHTLAKDKV